MSEKGTLKRKHDFIVYALISVMVIIMVTFLEHIDVFRGLEYATQDLRFRWRGPEPESDKIVIVAIDAQTLNSMGIIGMPERKYHVKLIENLYKAGAKAVMFDVLFLTYTGKSREDGSLSSVPSFQDSILTAAIKNYPKTIIARKEKVPMDRSSPNSVTENPLPFPLFLYPKQLAFVDMYIDTDSFVRRAKLITNDLDSKLGWNYSFALRAAMYAMNADTAWIDLKNHLIHVGDRLVPIDDDNTMIINYCMDERQYDTEGGYVSYEQVLDDETDYGLKALMKVNRFKDKVVLVGATFPDSKDVLHTPFYMGTKLYSKAEFPMYGVHVHKNIASTIIDNRFIPPVSELQTFILIFIMTLLATLVNYQFRGFGSLFLSFLIIAAYAGIALVLFTGKRHMIPVVAPAFATVLLLYISAVTYNFLAERRQKALIRGVFSHYVPGKVVGELLKNPGMLKLGGEVRVMTVIFSDVAGFTTISENLSPTRLVELLNEYLTAMTNIILSYDGIIDKYEGDAIMAEFGAPLPDDEHALKACYAAIDMQKKLVEMRTKWKSEGRAELKARVGINSGPMVIGNMGSKEIFDYTVMGDNVNLSSRLEGVNKVYGTYIICSEATRQMVEDSVITRELDLIRVKGKKAGVKIHEIIAKKTDGIGEEKQRLLETFNLGLEAYKNRRWEEGKAFFTEALAVEPSDGPSALYLERCAEFLLNPPQEDWDGIFTMRTK
jgi:adenylate cyclase